MIEFEKLTGLRIPVPPSVEIGCCPCLLTKPPINLSATNIFLSLEMDSARICLFLGSIATHNQINSEPTFNCVSSTIYSSIFFLFDNNFWGLYFLSNLLLRCDFLTNLDNAIDVFLNERPRKYKCIA